MSAGAAGEGAPATAPRWIARERDPYGPLSMGLLVGPFMGVCMLADTLGGWGLLAALTTLIGLWLLWIRASVGGGDARVEGDALVYVVDGRERRVPFARIVSAWRGALVIPGRRRPRAEVPAVVLQLSNRTTVRVSVHDPAEAVSLLLALGKDPSAHRAVFRGRRLAHSVLFWVLGPWLSLLLTGFALAPFQRFAGSSSPVAAVAAFALVFLGVRRVMRPRIDVEIGNNGVLDRTRWRGRFLPWSAVATVERLGRALLFRLHDGSMRRLWCNPDDDTVLPAAYERAREAHAAWQRAAATADPLGALDRNGRTIAQWRLDLAALATGDASYRAQGVDRARLEALVADPATPLERRVGASLALAHAAPEAAPTRVRVAAEANVDPAERELLLRIADGRADDAALEAALRAR